MKGGRMGLMKQKLKGAFSELKGRVKKVTGAATNDRDLQARGEGQEPIGRTRRQGAQAIDRGIGKVEGSVGKAQQKLADMTGNRSQQAEGAAREFRGNSRSRLS
jgi:uncharacterized protein YjbJ (UPF0337 family)